VYSLEQVSSLRRKWRKGDGDDWVSTERRSIFKISGAKQDVLPLTYDAHLFVCSVYMIWLYINKNKNII
jgi:hypothetical protein